MSIPHKKGSNFAFRKMVQKFFFWQKSNLIESIRISRARMTDNINLQASNNSPTYIALSILHRNYSFPCWQKKYYYQNNNNNNNGINNFGNKSCNPVIILSFGKYNDTFLYKLILANPAAMNMLNWVCPN